MHLGVADGAVAGAVNAARTEPEHVDQVPLSGGDVLIDKVEILRCTALSSVTISCIVSRNRRVVGGRLIAECDEQLADSAAQPTADR